MSHYQLISKLFPTFMMIGVIFIAGMVKNAVRQEKFQKEQRRVLEDRVALENALIARETFLQEHHKFLETFLEYEGQCNRIHLLLFPNHFSAPEVKSHASTCCPPPSSTSHPVTVNIQPGDRTPLNYATVYVCLFVLLFLFVRAVIDISKEVKSPAQNETKHSLKDYASRRCSVRRGSRVFGPFSIPTPIVESEMRKPSSPICKRSSVSIRRQSLAQQLFQDEQHLSFDRVPEETNE